MKKLLLSKLLRSKLLRFKLLQPKLLLSKLSLIAILLSTTTVNAHPGHLPKESVHSFLHVEHIIAILAIGLIAYFVSVMRNK